MAFTTATGYGNLPNGNFSPVIYSKKVQLAFRKSTVVGDITNSDYFGEIASQGDTVKIIKEPEISVSEYARGTNVTAQDLEDEDFNLVIDKANYFAFKMDDIEEAHSHVNFMDLATSRAAYRLADNHDQEVLAYMSGYKQSSLHSKGDKGLDTKSRKKSSKAAASAVVTKRSTKPSQADTEVTFTESQIGRMSMKDFEKHQDAIMEAQRTGKFVYDLSGGAR